MLNPRHSNPFLDYRRVGTNPSPPQANERASSEGRSVTHLTGHGHGHGGDQSGYSHPFQHMLHQHSGWSGQDGSGGGGSVGGAGPITGGVGTGSASSLTSSSSNEGMSSSGGLHQQGGGSSTGAAHGASNYHGEKYKYDRLNEADANADNRWDANQQYNLPLFSLLLFIDLFFYSASYLPIFLDSSSLIHE